MRRVFGYVLFLFGLLVMVLSVSAIFFQVPRVDILIAVAMAFFGLILCGISIFVASGNPSAGGG